MDRNQGIVVIKSILSSIQVADQRHVDHTKDVDGWLEQARVAIESIRDSAKLTQEEVDKIQDEVIKFDGRELLAAGENFRQEANQEVIDRV